MTPKVKREPISKRIRFEVFKRDSFRCNYCGNNPPTVTLEVDHIHPVSKGGDNTIENLITSCFDCNRGKSNIELSTIPKSISITAEEIQEREDQLKEYKRILDAKKRRVKKDIETIDDLYNKYNEGYILTDRFKNNSLKLFIEKLGVNAVEDAMHIACSRVFDENKVIKYFCAVCWNKIREGENG